MDFVRSLHDGAALPDSFPQGNIGVVNWCYNILPAGVSGVIVFGSRFVRKDD